MSESKATSGIDGVVLFILEPTATAPARAIAALPAPSGCGDFYEFERLEGDAVQPTLAIVDRVATKDVERDDIPGAVMDRLAEEGLRVQA